MEQHAAGERRRAAALNPRGNAARGSRAAQRAAAVTTSYRQPAEPPVDAGRHRSTWGRSRRILPIRWGRVAAGGLAVVAAGAGIVGVTLVVGRAGGSGHAVAAGVKPEDTSRPAPSGPAGAPAAGLGPTSASASPTPGSRLLIPSLVPVPPQPTGAAPSVLRVNTTPGPTGPVLTVSRTRVDLGSVDSTDTVALTDVGTQALTIRVGSLPSWLSAVPRVTSLDPGYQTQLVITLDRAAAPVGAVDVQIPVAPAAGSGGGTIEVTGVVAAGPRILSVTPPALRAQGCAASAAPAASPAPTSGALAVQVQDAVGMAGGTVAVTNPDGTTAVVPLRLGTTTADQSSWTAELGPAGAGTLAYTVTVKDLANRTASRQGSLTVASCS
jgi:hypothetical protein